MGRQPGSVEASCETSRDRKQWASSCDKQKEIGHFTIIMKEVGKKKTLKRFAFVHQQPTCSHVDYI
eukprot:1146130-Pelagomonas_calceolata.AAC.2